MILVHTLFCILANYLLGSNRCKLTLIDLVSFVPGLLARVLDSTFLHSVQIIEQQQAQGVLCTD